MNQPTPDERHWQLLVILLKLIAEKKGVSHQQIADATGLQKSNVTRIFGRKYCPTLKNFLAIATAVGVNFFFEDKDEQVDFNQLMERAMAYLGRRPDKLGKN